MMAPTPWESILSGYASNNTTRSKLNYCGSQTRKEFRENNLAVTSHVKGQHKQKRNKNKEVSPIQKDDTMCLINSGNSLFDSSQSNHPINHEYFTKTKKRNLEFNKKQMLNEEIKDIEYDTNEGDELSLSIDEASEDKSNNILLTYSDEDVKAVDEEIEMERVMKMNFYKFSSQNQNGIIGMCQKIKSK